MISAFGVDHGAISKGLTSYQRQLAANPKRMARLKRVANRIANPSQRRKDRPFSAAASKRRLAQNINYKQIMANEFGRAGGFKSPNAQNLPGRAEAVALSAERRAGEKLSDTSRRTKWLISRNKKLRGENPWNKYVNETPEATPTGIPPVSTLAYANRAPKPTRYDVDPWPYEGRKVIPSP